MVNALALIVTGLVVAFTASALWNSTRQRRDVRRVLAARREALALPVLDELELFTADEIAALTVSPNRARVRFTRYPDPWARDFHVLPHLLPIYANQLRLKFHSWTVGTDLAILLSGAVLGVAVNDIVREFSDGTNLNLSTTVLFMCGVLAVVVAAQIRIAIVAGWKSAADRYRELTLQSRQRNSGPPVEAVTTVSVPPSTLSPLTGPAGDPTPWEDCGLVERRD